MRERETERVLFSLSFYSIFINCAFFLPITRPSNLREFRNLKTEYFSHKSNADISVWPKSIYNSVASPPSTTTDPIFIPSFYFFIFLRKTTSFVFGQWANIFILHIVWALFALFAHVSYIHLILLIFRNKILNVELISRYCCCCGTCFEFAIRFNNVDRQSIILILTEIDENRCFPLSPPSLLPFLLILRSGLLFNIASDHFKPQVKGWHVFWCLNYFDAVGLSRRLIISRLLENGQKQPLHSFILPEFIHFLRNSNFFFHPDLSLIASFILSFIIFHPFILLPLSLLASQIHLTILNCRINFTGGDIKKSAITNHVLKYADD